MTARALQLPYVELPGDDELPGQLTVHGAAGTEPATDLRVVDVLDCATSAREHDRPALADALLDLARGMVCCARCAAVRRLPDGRCALCGAR